MAFPAFFIPGEKFQTGYSPFIGNPTAITPCFYYNFNVAGTYETGGEDENQSGTNKCLDRCPH
jgi:hypothetical protein